MKSRLTDKMTCSRLRSFVPIASAQVAHLLDVPVIDFDFRLDKKGVVRENGFSAQYEPDMCSRVIRAGPNAEYKTIRHEAFHGHHFALNQGISKRFGDVTRVLDAFLGDINEAVPCPESKLECAASVFNDYSSFFASVEVFAFFANDAASAIFGEENPREHGQVYAFGVPKASSEHEFSVFKKYLKNLPEFVPGEFYTSKEELADLTGYFDDKPITPIKDVYQQVSDRQYLAGFRYGIHLLADQSRAPSVRLYAVEGEEEIDLRFVLNYPILDAKALHERAMEALYLPPDVLLRKGFETERRDKEFIAASFPLVSEYLDSKVCIEE